MTNRVLPHLFPSANEDIFQATLERAIGIERPPPPSGLATVATDFELARDDPHPAILLAVDEQPAPRRPHGWREHGVSDARVGRLYRHRPRSDSSSSSSGIATSGSSHAGVPRPRIGPIRPRARFSTGSPRRPREASTPKTTSARRCRRVASSSARADRRPGRERKPHRAGAVPRGRRVPPLALLLWRPDV